MEKFTDTEGRDWTLAVTVASIERVRADTKIDLLEIGSDGKEPEASLAYKLFSDPILLARIIWSLVRLQAEVQSISVEQFGEAMSGDPLDQATEGLLAEIVNFTPNRRQREWLRKALEKMKGWRERGQDVLDQQLDSPAVEKKLEAELAKLESSFGNLPESPAETPAP